MDRPRIAICLLNYNQRRFALAALGGVLAQDYRPLDIVISDDCSTDGSDRMIEDELVRRFGAGEQQGIDRLWNIKSNLRIRFHRNPKNLGILSNTLQLPNLTDAELLVKADGDDVSHPTRVSRIVDAWSADGCRAMVVSHQGWKVDQDGRRIGAFTGVSEIWPRGAMMAFNRACWTRFEGPIAEHLMVDDEILSRRGRLLGHGLTLEDKLVDYRIGFGVSSTATSERASFLSHAPMLRQGFAQTDADEAFLLAHGGDRNQTEDAKANFAKEREILETMIALYGGMTMRARWRALKKSSRPAKTNPYYWIQLAMVLPPWLGNALIAAYQLINAMRKGLCR